MLSIWHLFQIYSMLKTKKLSNRFIVFHKNRSSSWQFRVKYINYIVFNYSYNYMNRNAKCNVYINNTIYYNKKINQKKQCQIKNITIQTNIYLLSKQGRKIRLWTSELGANKIFKLIYLIWVPWHIKSSPPNIYLCHLKQFFKQNS